MPTEERAEKNAEPSRSSMIADFAPLLVFVIAYRLKGIYWATASFMITAPAGLLFVWVRERKVRPMPVITAVVVLVFGGMTLWLGDPRFIYIKPTIITSLSGLVLLGGLLTGRSLMKPLLGSALAMADAGWKALTLRFAIFSLALAATNELVWRSVTPHAEHLWVWFKFLGIPGLTLLFMVSQAGLIKRHRLDEDPAEE